VIRPLEPGDAVAVAVLHQAFLRSRLKGYTGRRLLACYYRSLSLAAGGGCGYVEVESGSRIAGFVCGVWNPASVRQNLVRAMWGGLLLWGGLHVLLHPSGWGDLSRRLLPRHRQEFPLGGQAEYELRPIVVDEDFRGRGIAGQLLLRLLEDARSRGFKSIMLKTEVDNGRANAFYVKHGFVLERTAAGYNQYRRFLEP